MHRTALRSDAWRALPRPARAAVCVALVVLAHAALLGVVARDVAPDGRAVALHVRAVPIDMPIAVPTEGLAHAEIAAAERAARSAPAVKPSRPRGGRAPTVPVPVAAVEVAPPSADAMAALDTTAVALSPTRVPPPAQLHYALRRGDAQGAARLDWTIDGERYELRLHALMPRGRAIEQRSQGGFDDAGIAPLRLADRRAGRDVRAANFQRDRGTVSFSGPGWELPLQPGTQDRLSWLVQLAALAGAAPDSLREGAQWTMWVVGVRGASSQWRFEVRGRDTVGTASAWWLVREPSQPYDVRVEVWLDPMRGPWPLRMRQTQIPGGEPLEWTLRDDVPAAGT